MLATNFSWAARDGRSFADRFLKQIAQKLPKTVSDMESGWKLSAYQEDGLRSFSMRSRENMMAAYLYVCKFAPEDHPLKAPARLEIHKFLDGLKSNEILMDHMHYYEEGITGFLKGNDEELKLFLDSRHQKSLVSRVPAAETAKQTDNQQDGLKPEP